MDTRLISGSISSMSRPKKIYITLGVLLGIFVLTTIILGALFTREKIIEQKNDTCLSRYCINAANYIANSIDESVNPCEDFYQFACGSWLKNVRIPVDENAQNIVRFLERNMHNDIADILSKPTPNETALNCVKNARNFYSACTNDEQIEKDGVQPFVDLVNTKFGGWPITQGSSWNNSTFNLENLFVQLRVYGYNVIFRIHSNIDEQNSAATNIAVGQGLLGLPSRHYFETDTNVTIAYQELMRTLATALMTTNDTSLFESDLQEMYNFEKNISQYYWTLGEQRRRYNETVRTTLANLPNVFTSSFDFIRYLRDAYMSVGITLNDTDPVVVSEVEFLKMVSPIITNTPVRVLQNYLVWHFMMDQTSNMPRDYRIMRAEFDRVFLGIEAEERRLTKCAIMVNNNMGMAVSKLYVQNYFNKNIRDPAINMVDNIRGSFIDMIGQANWLDGTTKSRSEEKARATGHHVGYPDYLDGNNNTQIENAYAKYVFNSSHYQNVFLLHQLKAAESFQYLTNPVDLKAWTSVPTVIDSFYGTSQNSMILPAGILQHPYFNTDAPNYLNYGGLGTIIGHLFTRGFDDIGRQYDQNGNRNPSWWSPQAIDEFNNRKQCIIDQYENYPALNPLAFGYWDL
jgi:membrane metallo-endopeptidase-like protein 1